MTLKLADENPEDRHLQWLEKLKRVFPNVGFSLFTVFCSEARGFAISQSLLDAQCS